MKKTLAQLAGGLAMVCLSHSAMAASVLDFTNDNTDFTGTIEGTSYDLTGTPYAPNTNQAFDGNNSLKVSSGLTLDNDGVGISNDEVSTSQTLMLDFGKAVRITALSFLDIFGAENALVTFGNGQSLSVTAQGLTGGYALSSLNIVTDSIAFTAPAGLSDDAVNDFALASVSVSAVPVPAAAFLFAPALLGFMGLRRKAQRHTA